ncbi:DUF3093 domain-containing protein [Paeniglutamicibacter gangotriensis]|uniref:DUF3093 domain-containing protein n=1 Tax=Paeniglutamicibacter gangotriensis TaxID=254787 RepID=A0A5B0ENL0_9MICC|nr:DUF3093 domain-containing protein [Paeniglutamicibacter gangotriensis]KAA0979735.1 DUF3093 domain-containing protein [Paeniglutamicibacter gangotriensis]
MAENPSPTHPAPAHFREKLWPAWWIWLVTLGLAGTAAVAFIPIGIKWGVIGGLVALALIAFALINNTPLIEVDEDNVRVGRATIERKFIGEVTGYRAAAAYHQRGPGLNGIAFMCIRGWIDPVVRIEITDERDTTPYWITSTRRPEELTAALGGVMVQFREAALEQEQEQEQANGAQSPDSAAEADSV